MKFNFTDRYGGKSPSWLTSCHGQCDATGFVPVHKDQLNNESKNLVDAWHLCEISYHSNDGWHLIKCPDCNGTAKVDFYEAVKRIPNWLARGTKFVLQQRNNKPDWKTKSEHYKELLWAAFGADLKNL